MSMTLASVLATAATSSGVAFALAPLAQIRAIRKQGSSQGVSRLFLAAMLVNMSLWLAYGVASASPALVIANTASVAMTGLALAVAWRYRHGVPMATETTVEAAMSELTPAVVGA